MSTNTTVPLTGSSQGVPIIVTAIAHPAQIVHQAHATLHDFVTLWAANNHTTDVDVITYITAASTASNGSTPISSVITIPAKSGKFIIEPAIFMTGGNELKILASVTNVITYSGYVYRRDQS